MLLSFRSSSRQSPLSSLTAISCSCVVFTCSAVSRNFSTILYFYSFAFFSAAAGSITCSYPFGYKV